MGRGFAFIAAVILLLLGLPHAFQGRSNSRAYQTQAPAVKRSSSAIALTRDGATLLAVNPDANSLTVMATGSLATSEIPVGVDPRTVAVDDLGRTAYVANRGSNTVSVVDLAARQVRGEIAVGSRPYGVVASPDGRFLYVAEQGANRVRILDAAAGKTIRLISTGARPSGLALTGDGATLFVTHLLAQEIGVVDTRRPYASYFPAVGQGFNSAESVRAAGAAAGAEHVLVSSVALWPDSNLVQAIVLAPDGQTAAIPHTRSNTSNRALTFDTTVFPLVSLLDVAALEHLLGQQFDLGTLDPPGVGLPFDAAFTPDGGELWVLNAASNDVTVIDLAARRRTAHIEVGDNPRGIVLAPDGATAYVNNTLAGTVSIIDTAAYTVTETVAVTEIPMAPLLLEGKRLFNSSDDPRLSKDQWIACSSCHFDNEQDGRTWFFGFAGPRNTTSLLGMIETYPLRWSGEWDESADSEFALRKENFGSGLIKGDMHCALQPPDCVAQPPNQGRDDALDALAAYIDSLPAPLSPQHARGERLSPAAQRGRALFHDPHLGCVACHPPPLYTDQQMHDVGTATADEKIGSAYDTPSLRGLYNSAPYFHDGSAATLGETLIRPSPAGEHDMRSKLSEQEMQDLLAYLEALPYEN